MILKYKTTLPQVVILAVVFRWGLHRDANIRLPRFVSLISTIHICIFLILIYVITGKLRKSLSSSFISEWESVI